MNDLMVPAMELEEAIRWCFRHYACVDFSEGERGEVVMTIATPLRGEEHCDRVSITVPNHDEAGSVFLEVVNALRKRLGYE